MLVEDTIVFGQAVKKRRKKLGFTQKQISEFTGFSISFLSDLENGKKTVEIGRALVVAQVLGLDCFLKERN